MSMPVITGTGGDPSQADAHKSAWKSRTWGSSSSSWNQQSASTFTSGSVPISRGRQATLTFGHPYRSLGRARGNIGGKFLTVKGQVLSAGAVHALERVLRDRHGVPYVEERWTGRLLASQETGSWLRLARLGSEQEAVRLFGKAPVVSDVNLDGLGATAISRVAPTNPLVDLSSALAELYREGLPSVPGQAGNVGGEYLNYQFGIAPTVGTFSDAVKVARDHDSLLQQYERDSGRWIRREYRFPRETEVSSTTSNFVSPDWLGGSPSGHHIYPGTLTTVTTSRTDVWFSGAFTYHLPKSGWRRTAAELDHLYGVVPGVDTVWELTPYSWLADYFTNMGDVAKNITAFTQDGLVMPYGYIMRTQSVDVESTWTGDLRINSQWQRSVLYDHVKYVIKQRRSANPFGFGVSGDLTGRQMSILTALGISKVL